MKRWISFFVALSLFSALPTFSMAGNETSYKNFYKPSFGSARRTEWSQFNASLDDTDATLGANVLAYGADPTGVADSTVAIQNAIDSGSKKVRAAAGTFKITSPIDMKDGVDFGGLGEETIINNAGTGVAIRYSSANAVNRSYLHDMKIIDAGSGTDLIYMDGAVTNNVVERIHLVNAGQHGVNSVNSFSNTFRNVTILNATSYGMLFGADSNDIAIEGCHISGCDIGIRLNGSLAGFTISDQTSIESCTTAGFYIYRDGYIYSIQVRDSYFEASAGTQILIDSATSAKAIDVLIEGNYFYSSSGVTAHISVDEGTLVKIKHNVMGDNSAAVKHIVTTANAGEVDIYPNYHYGSGTFLDIDPATQLLSNNTYAYVSKNANYETTLQDYMIRAYGAGTTITLMENAPQNKRFMIKRVDASNNIVVSRKTADTIDGAASVTLDSDYEAIEVMSDGANYHIVGERGFSVGAGGGEANTASNYGVGGVGLWYDKSGVDLRFKNINSGTDTRLSVTDDGPNREVDIDIDLPKSKLDATTAPGSGNDNTEGYEVGSQWCDVTADKEYVCLDASTGAAVWTETTAGAAGGEANTASNYGVGGVGLWYDKNGVDLRFKNINNGTDSRLTVTNDGTNREVDIDIDFPKSNLAATSNPTANDDNTQGYEVGSQWVNTTTDHEYVCADASTGAAVWMQTTGSGGSDSRTDVDAVFETIVLTAEGAVVGANIAQQIVGGSGYIKQYELEFENADTGNDAEAFWTFVVPDNYNASYNSGNSKVTLWYYNDGASPVQVTWAIGWRNWTDNTYNPASTDVVNWTTTINDTAGTQYLVQKTAETNFNPDWTPGDMVTFGLKRTADTEDDTVNFLKFRIEIPVDHVFTGN